MSNQNLNSFTEFPYQIEVYATNLLIPWAMAISKEGKIYVTERIGRVWVIEDHRFLPQPLITLEAPFISEGEGGLLGIALDPDFIENHFIYVMHTYYENGNFYNRVVRLLESNDKATIHGVIIDKIPGGRIHNGGRIKIGPDRKLYITTGDAGNAAFAQDIQSLAGKILRLELDGRIPIDNPFHNSPVYSLGHRNPQGLAWNSNQALYASEHGQTANDEINIILPGANYGWPLVQGSDENLENRTVKPLLHSNTRTWAPSGIAFIHHGLWNGRLLIACLRGEQLISITLNNRGLEVESLEIWLVHSFGRLREVIEADDGSIYLTTSNRDGRGNPDPKDDKIIHLIPKDIFR